MCHRSFIRFTGSNSGVLADSWMRSGLNGSLEQNELLFWGLKLRRLVMNDLVSIWSILVSIYYASIYCFPVILRLLRIISCYNVYIYTVYIYIYIIQITTVSSKYLKGTVLWLGLNCTDWENSTGEDNSTRLKSLLQHPYPHWTYLHGCVQSSACQPRARVTSIPSDPAGIWAARCLSIQSADQNSSRQNSRKHRNPGSQLARPVALEFSKCTPRRTTTSHAECCYSPNMFPHLPNYRFANRLAPDISWQPWTIWGFCRQDLETETLGSVISIDFPGKHHSTLCNFHIFHQSLNLLWDKTPPTQKNACKNENTHPCTPQSWKKLKSFDIKERHKKCMVETSILKLMEIGSEWKSPKVS